MFKKNIKPYFANIVLKHFISRPTLPSQSKNKSVHSKSQIKRREREKSSIRAKVEHVFGVVKGLLGYRKTRYKGRRKQSAKLHMIFALANLFLADKRFGLIV
ncbi:transposase [Eubacteriales bacterium OttesenSCG-928-A19]|nr:transposase [Eubacteriales bacterium OttesenSCG-928-A19]